MKKIIFVIAAVLLVAAGCSAGRGEDKPGTRDTEVGNHEEQNLPSVPESGNSSGGSSNSGSSSQPIPGNVAKPQPREDDMACAQVITRATNTKTGEIREFPTACLPEGWVRVETQSVR